MNKDDFPEHVKYMKSRVHIEMLFDFHNNYLVKKNIGVHFGVFKAVGKLSTEQVEEAILDYYNINYSRFEAEKKELRNVATRNMFGETV